MRDVGLLDSAVARPRSSAFGQDAYPTLGLKAAALLESVARHCGNTCLGWFACVVFLDLNGHETSLENDGAFELVMAVATGERDLASTAAALGVRRLHRP